jgi:DNA modification methylase
MNPAGRGKAAIEDEKTGHSTQKPVECMARPIRNHDAAIVYDPFIGSGTTFVACENLGRLCRGIEVDPGYCAVTLERLSAVTGTTPVRLE